MGFWEDVSRTMNEIFGIPYYATPDPPNDYVDPEGTNNHILLFAVIAVIIIALLWSEYG